MNWVCFGVLLCVVVIMGVCMGEEGFIGMVGVVFCGEGMVFNVVGIECGIDEVVRVVVI